MTKIDCFSKIEVGDFFVCKFSENLNFIYTTDVAVPTYIIERRLEVIGKSSVSSTGCRKNTFEVGSDVQYECFRKILFPKKYKFSSLFDEYSMIAVYKIIKAKKC
jgi:hypothetical protein